MGRSGLQIYVTGCPRPYRFLPLGEIMDITETLLLLLIEELQQTTDLSQTKR